MIELSRHCCTTWTLLVNICAPSYRTPHVLVFFAHTFSVPILIPTLTSVEGRLVELMNTFKTDTVVLHICKSSLLQYMPWTNTAGTKEASLLMQSSGLWETMNIVVKYLDIIVVSCSVIWFSVLLQCGVEHSMHHKSRNRDSIFCWNGIKSYRGFTLLSAWTSLLVFSKAKQFYRELTLIPELKRQVSNSLMYT